MESPFSPELHREIVVRAKTQIRARMKALRGAHSQKSLALRSARLATRLLEMSAFSELKSVGLFWPIEGRGEVDLREVDAGLRARGDVEIYYPFMEALKGGGFSTGFRRASTAVDLRDRGNGFLEPEPEERRALRGDLDLVLVPALAADARGHRVGYGAGYYDATLKDLCPPAKCWITAYHFQFMSELPTEDHDWPCDAVLTDEGFYPAARTLFSEERESQPGT